MSIVVFKISTLTSVFIALIDFSVLHNLDMYLSNYSIVFVKPITPHQLSTWSINIWKVCKQGRQLYQCYADALWSRVILLDMRVSLNCFNVRSFYRCPVDMFYTVCTNHMDSIKTGVPKRRMQALPRIIVMWKVLNTPREVTVAWSLITSAGMMTPCFCQLSTLYRCRNHYRTDDSSNPYTAV